MQQILVSVLIVRNIQMQHKEVSQLVGLFQLYEQYYKSTFFSHHHQEKLVHRVYRVKVEFRLSFLR